MIIALLFVTVFAVGIVLIPIGWFGGGLDVKPALILWVFMLSTLYLFDAKVITDLVQFYSSLPWSGYP